MTHTREGVEGCTTTINCEKLQAVTKLLQVQVDRFATAELVRFAICTWDNGAKHQTRMDRCHPQEITDWLAMFYDEDYRAQESCTR